MRHWPRLSLSCELSFSVVPVQYARGILQPTPPPDPWELFSGCAGLDLTLCLSTSSSCSLKSRDWVWLTLVSATVECVTWLFSKEGKESCQADSTPRTSGLTFQSRGLAWTSLVIRGLRVRFWYFLGPSTNPSANAGDMVQSLLWKHSTCCRTTKPVCPSHLNLHILELVLCNKRSHRKEKPICCRWRVAPILHN